MLNDMDKWIYLLKHMSALGKIPAFLNEGGFQHIFQIAEVAKLRKERMAYEASLKARWAVQNAFDSVRREGF